MHTETVDKIACAVVFGFAQQNEQTYVKTSNFHEPYSNFWIKVEVKTARIILAEMLQKTFLSFMIFIKLYLHVIKIIKDVFMTS